MCMAPKETKIKSICWSRLLTLVGHFCENLIEKNSSKHKSQKVKLLSRVRLFATPWTVAHQAPPSMGFSRQEYWSGMPFPSPGDLPGPGIEPRSLALQADALTAEPPGKPHVHITPVAQMVKNLPAMGETQAWSLGWENPVEKGLATHSSIFAWRSLAYGEKFLADTRDFMLKLYILKTDFMWQIIY